MEGSGQREVLLAVVAAAAVGTLIGVLFGSSSRNTGAPSNGPDHSRPERRRRRVYDDDTDDDDDDRDGCCGRHRQHHHSRSPSKAPSRRPSGSSGVPVSQSGGDRSHDRQHHPRTTISDADNTLKAAMHGLHPDWEGFSMEDAREFGMAKAEKAAIRTPAQVLMDLQRGNARFWMGSATRPEVSAFERRALISLQYPSVAILGCSDSRVPIEIVFDHGLGDIFVIRVAGNCLDTTTTASLQYAINHLRVKVIVVMGHEGCGALKAASLPIDEIEKEASELCIMLKMIKGGLDEDQINSIKDNRARDREACVANVRNQLCTLATDGTVMDQVKNSELLVVGAFYNISSGIVDFFDQITDGTDLTTFNPRSRLNSFCQSPEQPGAPQ